MSTSNDAHHLRLLSVFHYVVAGVLGLFSMFPLVHLAIGIAIVTGAFDNLEGAEGTPPPAIFGWIFVLFPAVFILCGLAMATSIAIAGRCLGHYRKYTYCLVIAGLECCFMPFGTVLGVFTILVLVRPTVKAMFDVDPAAP